MNSPFRKAIDSMPLSVKPVFAGLLALAIAGLFFFICFRLELYIYNLDVRGFSGLLQDTSNPIFVPVLRYFMAIQTIALFAITPLVVAWCYDKNVLSLFLLDKKPPLFYLVLSVCLIIFANPFINLLLEFNGTVMDYILGASNSLKDQDLGTQKLVDALLKNTSLLSLMINTIVIAFLPAALEELFFRGFLQKVILSKYMNVHMAILSTAFFFSFIHFQFYGFLPRFVLGIIFGYILLWSGSLWVTISIHFVNNFMAVFANYLVTRHLIENSIDSIGTGSTAFWGLLSAVIVSCIIGVMYKKYQSKQFVKPIQSTTFA